MRNLLVISGGGDSFSDIYGLQRMVFGSLMSISAILMGKKLVLLPQTYGPYEHSLSRIIARCIIKNSSVIMARDQMSVDFIKKDLLKNKKGYNVRFCPDVAFVLDSIAPQAVSIIPPLERNEYIGLNVSGLLYNGGYSRDNMFGLCFDYKIMIYKLIINILEATKYDLVLVPHVFSDGIESDYNACLDIHKMVSEIYPERVHVVCGDYDQSQIKSIVGKCEFFIGSRMHACIAAVSQNVPSIGIAYSQKFFGVFDSVGLGSFTIDGRSVNESKLIDICMDLIRHKNDAYAVLNRNIPVIKEQLSLAFHDLFGQYAS